MSKFVFYFKFFISGLAFGIANIIPGVSGGTMLVVFGIYDKLTEAISGVKSIIKNLGLLISFVFGAGTGIIGFAFVITWLFENFGVQTNMFFIGLILGSVPLIVRIATENEKIKPLCIVPFLVGLALVVGLAVAESRTSVTNYHLETAISGNTTEITIFNDSSRVIEEWEITLSDDEIILDGSCTGAVLEYDYSTIDKIKQKLGIDVPTQAANMFTSPKSTGQGIDPGDTWTVSYEGVALDSANLELSISYKMDVGFFMTMMVALFIAAVAMIIPGVSGSFVMMMIGVYSTVIGAIKDLDFMIIIPCAIGALLGIMLGAKLISTLIKKHGLMVYSLIMGLVIGSVYAILPAGFGFNLSTGYGFVTLICGILVSILIDKIGKISDEK